MPFIAQTPTTILPKADCSPFFYALLTNQRFVHHTFFQPVSTLQTCRITLYGLRLERGSPPVGYFPQYLSRALSARFKEACSDGASARLTRTSNAESSSRIARRQHAPTQSSTKTRPFHMRNRRYLDIPRDNPALLLFITFFSSSLLISQLTTLTSGNGDKEIY
jgi:hypothetical protein